MNLSEVKLIFHRYVRIAHIITKLQYRIDVSVDVIYHSTQYIVQMTHMNFDSFHYMICAIVFGIVIWFVCDGIQCETCFLMFV